MVEPIIPKPPPGRRFLRCLSVSAFLLTGCPPQTTPQGTLNIALTGGNGVEATVPASEFQDNWRLTFSRLLVVFSDVTVTSTLRADRVARDNRSVLVNLVTPGPTPWAAMLAPEGVYDRVTLSLKPATASTVILNATPADLQRMQTGGWSLLAEGTLAQGSISKTFSWGFSPTVRYTGCELLVEVLGGAPSGTRFTMHGEQLFLESLVRTSPRLRAQAQADADTDNNGVITSEELAAINGAAFQALTWPEPGSFSDVDSLLAYSEAVLVRSVRMPAEGECTTVTVQSALLKDGGP